MMSRYFFDDKILNALLMIVIWVFVAVFFYVDTQIKLMFLTVLLPLLIGFIFQEKFLWTSNQVLYRRSRAMMFYSLFFCIYFFLSASENWNYPDMSELLFIYTIFLVWWILIWSILMNDSKYMPEVNLEITYIYVVMFSYWMWGIYLFCMSFIYLGIISIMFHSTKNMFLEWLLSMSYSMMSIIFWCGYIFYMYHKYVDVFDFQSVNVSSFIVMAEFLFLWLSIWYMLQSFFMICVYLPWKNQFYWVEHRRMMRETNMKLLERFNESDFMFKTFLINASLMIFFVILHHITNFLPVQLFVWVTIIFLSSMNLYMLRLIKT